MIANIAVLAGHIGKARAGIIQLKPKNNSQGLADIGINADHTIIEEGIKGGIIKGMMIFGEDIPNVDVSNLEFLMVQDMYLTETAKKADVVLPSASYAESKGTFTNAERRIQTLKVAIPSLTGEENWVDLCDLAAALGIEINYSNVDDITEELTRNVPEYYGFTACADGTSFWPIGEGHVLYTKGYNFACGKAQLQVVEDGKLLDKVESTDAHGKMFKEILKDNGII